MLITVFTPTYNRAYILPVLYHSLLAQTSSNFEWLIVDDGSQDNTKELIQQFVDEKQINIRYIYQPNGGKHSAINRGVQNAQGELFFIVDSDDNLSSNAIEVLQTEYKAIQSDVEFAGISGVRVDFDGHRIGGDFPYSRIDCSALEIRMKYGIKGDLAEAYKTDILKKYPFPIYPSEYFVPEALIWNRIALHYKIRYINSPIYRCQYRSDGLTAQITRLRQKSPRASLQYYSELCAMPIPIYQKIKALTNYWRFAPCLKTESVKIKMNRIGVIGSLFIVVGYICYIFDNIRFRL